MSIAPSPGSAAPLVWLSGARPRRARRGRPKNGTRTRTELAIDLNPLEQFEIERLIPIHIGGIDLSFTNSAMLMTVAAALVTALLVLGTRNAALVPGRWQSLAELSYEFIGNMIDGTVGHEGREYFPFVFTLFMFILFGNMLGLVPYSFTFTSHIIVTFALAAVVFIGVTVIGFARHGLHFLRLFVPAGDPAVRQHAGRAYDARDLWRARREHRAARHPAPGRRDPALRPRALGCGIAGLCVRDPDLSLPQRRHPHALRSKSHGSRFGQIDRRRPCLHRPRGRRHWHRHRVRGLHQRGCPQPGGAAAGPALHVHRLCARRGDRAVRFRHGFPDLPEVTPDGLGA